MSYRPGRAIRILGSAGLVFALGLTACATEDDEPNGVDQTSPAMIPEAAVAGAQWLTDQLTDGVLVNRQFSSSDYSTTVDLAYALRAVDPDSVALPAITDKLVAGVREYASPGKEIYSGSTAKLVSFAADFGGDPRDFGGEDLVAQLEQRTADDGATRGRISDLSEYGDYANSFGQAWAVRGLTLAGSGEAEAARDYLLQQQCEAGFIRLYFADTEAPDQTCDGAGVEPEPVDTTALAYVLLHDLAEGDETLSAALEAGVDYILAQQATDGSFSGGSGQPAPNANSTGLAGWALRLAGESAAASGAATWLRAHQVGDCEGNLADESGAIGFDDATLAAAGQDGLTKKTEFQWRLATAQALPALLTPSVGETEGACPTAS